MAFLCVCPEKSLEFGADEKLHRSAKEQFIRGVLESVNLGSENKAILTLPGGGVAVQHNDAAPKIAIDPSSSTLGVLTGSIQNYSYLVKKYLQLELHLPQNVTLEAIKERMPVTEAELLCKMYSQMGTGMISKLRGHFSFCIYDATTVRVLAARDCSGSVPLVQGKLSDNSLFIASGDAYPGDACELEDIPAGHYKYGWHAHAMKFANPESEARHSAEQASSAADAALAGLFCKPTHNITRRSSFDSASLSQSRKAGSRRGSLEGAGGRRFSMDSASSKTKADGHSWWRSNKGEESARPVPTRSSRKRSKKSRSKQATPSTTTPSTTPEAKSPAEEFINKLGWAIHEDSASVRMLMKLLEDSPCSLVITDAKDENLVFVNKSFEEQTGYRSEKVIGKNCRFLQAPPGGSIVQSPGSRALRRAIKDGRSCSARLINYKRNGTPVFNTCSVVPLRDREGRITHYIGMHTFQSFAEDNDSAEPAQQKSSMLLKSRSCGDMASVISAPSALLPQEGSVAF